MGKREKEKQIGTPVPSCSCWSTVIQLVPGHSLEFEAPPVEDGTDMNPKGRCA